MSFERRFEPKDDFSEDILEDMTFDIIRDEIEYDDVDYDFPTIEELQLQDQIRHEPQCNNCLLNCLLK